MFVQFKLSELEGQATQPDGCKDKGNSVDLVVDKLVVVVTLEDELVVDIVFPENLNIYSGRYHYENDTPCENETLNVGIKLIPVLFAICIRNQGKVE